MDELDFRILKILQKDGRKTNTAISRALGVAESTVRKRINRMTRSEAIQFTAVADPYRLGFTIWVQLGIVADLGRVEALSKQLSAFPEVFFLAVTNGEFNITLSAVFKSNDKLYDFLTRRLGGMTGIRRSITSIFLRVVKRTFVYSSV